MGELFNAIASFFSIIFSYIYAVIPNFGITIILFTILVKLIIFPLNNQQIRSARRMQLLQPEMKKIQQKYKDNKEKQNEEVMKFMQENKVNPLAGCVPLLIQFPILLGVFRMLKDAEYFGITELANFNPYLFPFLAGTSFDWSNLLLIDNFYILPAIAGITTYLYSRLTMTDPNQKMLLYMMPAMIFYFGLKLPSGLVLYWVINNFLSIGQHYYLNSKDKKEAEVMSK